MLVWGGWWVVSRPVPVEYRLFAVSPCGGDAICLDVGDRYSNGGPLVMLIAIAAVYLLAVFVLQRGLTGHTLGSMLFGFAVVDEQHRPLGINRALVRSVAGAVDYLPCCLPVVGITTIAATPSNQRVGDLAAGSIVIDLLRPSLPWSASPDESTDGASRPRIGRDETLPSRPPTPSADAPPHPPGPLWDPTRGVYVLWDDTIGGWLWFDDTAQQWRPLEQF